MGKKVCAFFPGAGWGKVLRLKHVGMIGENFEWQVSLSEHDLKRRGGGGVN